MLSGSNFNTKSSQLIIELPKTHLKTPITTEENENEKDRKREKNRKKIKVHKKSYFFFNLMWEFRWTN